MISDFREDDDLSHDALRVPSRVAIEHRRRRRRYRRPQPQTVRLVPLLRDIANRLQRSTPVPQRLAKSSTSATTVTTREVAVQCELLVPQYPEEPVVPYDIDPTEIDYQMFPTFVHQVIDHHGQPAALYVASLPLMSPAARPTLRIRIAPTMPFQSNEAEETSSRDDRVTEPRAEH
jgi:hypothetical protein